MTYLESKLGTEEYINKKLKENLISVDKGQFFDFIESGDTIDYLNLGSSNTSVELEGSELKGYTITSSSMMTDFTIQKGKNKYQFWIDKSARIYIDLQEKVGEINSGNGDHFYIRFI